MIPFIQKADELSGGQDKFVLLKNGNVEKALAIVERLIVVGREVRPVLPQIKRNAVVGIVAVSLGVLAVACSGVPQLTSTTGGFHAAIGSFSVQLPDLKLPFLSSSPMAVQSQTVTTAQDTLQGAVHSGEACPIALPQ